ncbi:hypothetical protein [uncultured Mitsuokella sp.]|uniref:hypothetical protein n=1 Tax=uncultured Mitsuokella sp. TaxID=453120 RepID=UPI00266EC03A|nr:hypothetical protein [uncultured Mitsuokella sp.]
MTVWEEAEALIRQMPEDQVTALVKELQKSKRIEEIFHPAAKKSAKSMRAYENLRRMQKPGAADFDYKAELADAREERYAHLN